MYILIRGSIYYVLVFYKIGGSWWVPMASFHFVVHIVAKLLCFCLCLFDAIAELYAMDDKMFNDFLNGKWEWII